MLRASNITVSFGSFSLSLGAVLWALAASGCSSSSDGDGASTATSSVSAAEASSFCDSYCKKQESCDSRVDVQTCAVRCDDGVTSTLERLRADLVDATRACFEASDCRQVLGGKRLSECIDEAAVSVTPSKAATTFCDALTAAAKECFDVDHPRVACLEQSKTYSDATLAEATKCMAKSCKQRFACESAVLGVE